MSSHCNSHSPSGSQGASCAAAMQEEAGQGLQDTASAQEASVEGSDAELGLSMWLSQQ